MTGTGDVLVAENHSFRTEDIEEDDIEKLMGIATTLGSPR